MAVQSKLSPIENAFVGSASAMFALAVVYPLDIIKTRIQVDATAIDNKDSSSALKGIQEILKTESIQDFYNGLGVSLFGTAMTNFTYFCVYTLIRTAYISKHYQQQTLSTVKELLLGAAAGAIITLIVNPINLITTRQQTQTRKGKRTLTIFQIIIEILKNEGIQGFWKGIKPSLVLCVNPAITYGMFEKIKQVIASLDISMTPMVSFTAGALSKTLATVVTYPYIMAKVRLQTITHGYKNSFDFIHKITKEQGFFGLYKGMSTQISKAVLSQALLFMIEDIFTKYALLIILVLKKKKVFI